MLALVYACTIANSHSVVLRSGPLGSQLLCCGPTMGWSFRRLSNLPLTYGWMNERVSVGYDPRDERMFVGYEQMRMHGQIGRRSYGEGE